MRHNDKKKQVNSLVQGHICARANSQVLSQAGDAVYYKTLDQLRLQLDNQVWYQVADHARDQVIDNLRNEN